MPTPLPPDSVVLDGPIRRLRTGALLVGVWYDL